MEINKNKSDNPWCGRLLAITFLLLIIAGTVFSILAPKRKFSENENRFLQQMPDLNLKTFFDGTFESEYETYVTDQFVLRDDWIALKTNVERLLQKKDINGVYFAKDDYLIERHEANQVNEEQAQKNIDRLTEFMNGAIAKLGEDRVHAMIVPTTSEILTDKLPAFATGYDQQAVIEEVKQRVPEASVVDVTDTLKEHSDEYIYYKTDHHWTTLGAYYAYEAWAKTAGFEPFSREEFEVEMATGEFYGTIASKVNVSVKPDEMYLYKKLGNPLYKVEYNQTETTDSLYNYDRLDTKDKYSVYLNGNNALVKITSENKNGRKLLVIKDSFAHCFVPFLVDHYEEVYMIDFRYFRMGVSQFMEQEGVTDVLVLYNVMGFVEDINTLTFIR